MIEFFAMATSFQRNIFYLFKKLKRFCKRNRNILLIISIDRIVYFETDDGMHNFQTINLQHQYRFLCTVLLL